ncbi:MAG: hypothetical protein WC552_03590 [Candidatus Omnitrophota bacterium]
MAGPLSKNMKQHLVAALLIAGIVLFGYYKIFLGADFFLYEDDLAISGYTYGNTLGNGWRPDKGLGISFFFGDVGVWHPWGVLTWLEHISPSRAGAYSFSVVSLGILSAVALYFFILKVVPNADKKAAVLLSPLIVFCADQGGQHFLRLNISLLAATPLFLMLLFNYYKSPRLIHFFGAALLFWFVPFLGNLWSLFQLWSLGFVFTVFYVVYFRETWGKIFRRMFLLYGIAIAAFILLGFWEIYTLFLEKSLVGYMREKFIGFKDVSWGLNWKMLPHYLAGLIHSEWLPVNGRLAGMGDRIFIYLFNIAVVFPLVFLFFLFRRAAQFWEFALKGLLAVFLIHWGLLLTNIIPGYETVFSYISNSTSKVFTMYDFVFPLQAALLAIFIAGMTKENIVIKNRWGRGLQWCVALILAGLYAALTVFAFVAVVSPGAWPGLLAKVSAQFLPVSLKGHSREFLTAVAVYNIGRVQGLMHWHSVLFYLTSVLLAAPFLRKAWLVRAAQMPKVWIAALVIVNGILLSWTVFPLNERKSVWEQKEISAYPFEPTDRFYFVKNVDQKMEKNLPAFRERWVEVEGGGNREPLIGLLEPPGLNISGLKSFATKAEGDFIFHVFNGDGVPRLAYLRLYYGGPTYFSELLDMAAVKYYYSDLPIADLPQQVTLLAKAKQLYVYRNNAAWPYFYLAERFGVKKEGEHLRDVKPGTAYVSREDIFPLSKRAGTSKIRLKSFSYGELIFDFEGKQEEFLVVADAWHPFWKALADGKRIPVVQANEIFKGIRLPAGTYQLTLVFDAAPYKKGIPVAIVSWIVFLAGLIGVISNRNKPFVARELAI